MQVFRKLMLAIGLSAVCQTTLFSIPQDYTWTTPSRNASESMPCGGGDIGMNVWAEQDGNVYVYLSRSGYFDENNTLLKSGRLRIKLTPVLDMSTFRQTLHLNEGYVEVGDAHKTICVWADVYRPVVHVDVECKQGNVQVEAAYQNWRMTARELTARERFQTSYKFAAPKGLVTRCDSVTALEGSLFFSHTNPAQTIFDATVAQQQLEAVKADLYNPIGSLIAGGMMRGEHFRFAGEQSVLVGSTPATEWCYRSVEPQRQHRIEVVFAATQAGRAHWQRQLQQTAQTVSWKADRTRSRQWWQAFWQRSFVEGSGASEPLARNYTLFRYMLGCNAHSAWPTKFNGGLFTFDPEYVNEAAEYRLTPDFRNWGGGVHTAQNQRLVYWPMLKNGDFDALTAQLEFYRRTLHNAEQRSQHYWNHGGACFTEQMENYGLPCYPEYGTKRPAGFDPGMERNAWLEYEWDTALEFCQMALEAARYSSDFDVRPYLPLVRSCLQFFDEHYQYLASQRGAKKLDGAGKLVLYPGSGGETFKGAYNAASTVAALLTVTQTLNDWLGGDSLCQALLKRLPAIPLRTIEGHAMIAPAQLWERVQNVESTMLYPVYPWRVYGIGRDGLDLARNTYYYDDYAQQFRSHVGWKQDNIFAACLGLTDEAARLTGMKLADGPHRFPAFWGPGFDWTPDHNWGGSGMIGVQEMLMQEVGDSIFLFPAWPKDWDIHFKLHASRNTTVEVTLRHGKVQQLVVVPRSREQDVKIML